jgi:hypothetical protein
MAFSPFRAFRKHQKAFFAGLTIVCMLTFVLAGSMSRGGDFFSWISSLIGGSREPKVAVLNGKPVYRAEILNLRNQRQLANQYMDLLTQQAQENFARSLLDASSKLDDSLRKQIQQVVNGRIWAGRFRKVSEDVRRQHLGQLSGQIKSLGFIAELLQERKKEAEAAMLMEFRDQLQRDLIQIQGIKDKNELFFGGTLRFEDLLDFMIWKHEADRRGIQLTMADIRELVNRETGRRLTSTDFRNVENILRDNFHNIMNADTLRAGLADEFRVRIVKAAVMGEETSGASTSITPYEFWQFYRDQRTENLIAVLPIPVRNQDFLSQVGQPKDDEVKTLFAEGKGRESDPASDKPGFKVPPRIGVEWVSARADSEHYRKAAEVTLAATQATLPLAYEAALNREYDIEKYNYPLPSWTDNSNFLLHDSSVNRPENVAAMVGQLASGGMQPMAFSGGMSYTGTATSREFQDRLRIGLNMIRPVPLTTAALAYFGIPKTQFVPFASLKDRIIEQFKEKMSKDLVARNMEELWNELFKHGRQTAEQILYDQSFYRSESIAGAIGASSAGITGGIPAFTVPISFCTPGLIGEARLRKQLGGQMILAGMLPNPFTTAGLVYRQQNLNVEVVRGIIDRTLARYRFRHGFSEKPRNVYDIELDDGLRPLRESFLRFQSNRAGGPEKFSSLFWPKNYPFQQVRIPYLPGRWPQMEIDTQRLGQQLAQEMDKMNDSIWKSTDEPFLFWKTEDRPAYAPTFDEAKDKVIASWKFDKARGLAEKEAKQVKAEAMGKPDAERRFKDGSKHSDKWFYLTDQYDHDKVAKLVRPGPTGTPEPFRFAKRQIEYPPADLADELIAMTQPGQVIVRADQPKAIYYVIALVDHEVPSTKLFYREYNIAPEAFFQEIEETTHYRREFEKNLLTELRREAGLEIIEENRDLVDQTSRSDEE